MTRLALFPCVCLAAACSSPQKIEPLPDPPDTRTVATLSGPLCRNTACTCREADDAAGEPEGKYKRFEFRLGPTENELWATVGEMVLYKSRERATDCFYVDLLPGNHQVSVRARGDNGFGAKMTISELGTGGPWWYDTFDFSCGAPGMCDQQTLTAWKQEIAGYKQKHDPCGSTKIKGVTWQTGTMPDNIHPSEIRVELTMQVYEFAPEYGPGDDSCVNRGEDGASGDQTESE